MAEVAPLLTPQGWQLVTPVAASGAATGGAVGGAAGLALAAAGAGILVLAFLMAKRASQRAAAAKGKAAPKGAAKPSAAAAGSGGARGLLNRLKPSGRANSGSGGAGSSGGGRSGGGRGRLRLPGRGTKSGTGSTGAGPAGGSKSGSGGGARKGTGRLAGLRGKLPGRTTGAGGSAGQKSAAGGRSGGSPAKSKGSGPGLVQRARNIGRARKLGAARQRVLGQPGRGSRDAGAKPSGQKPGSVRRGLGYLTTGRKTPTGGGQQKAGPKGGMIGPATGAPRKGRLQKVSQLIPSGKRARLANRGAAGASTPGGGSTAGGSAAPTGRRGTSAVARRAIDNATSSSTTPIGKRRRSLGGTMPIIRRPQINKTGLARTDAARLGSAPASGRTPFAAVIEACGQASHTYSPDNALRAIEWYEGMPQLIEAIASMFAAHAAKNAQDFYLYPAAADIANALGEKFLAYRGPCDDARGAFEAAHAEDLAKLRDPKRNQEKWDLTLNRE